MTTMMTRKRKKPTTTHKPPTIRGRSPKRMTVPRKQSNASGT